MTGEFVDTNVLLYAHGVKDEVKRAKAVDLLTRLFEHRNGMLSIQVLVEFYAAATRKAGMNGEQAEAIMRDFGQWTVHRPAYADLIQSIRLQRRHQLSWWDAMIVNSAIEAGAAFLWTEDLNDGQRFGSLTIRNPFA